MGCPEDYEFISLNIQTSWTMVKRI
jgi:hypothetical protein